ncbi:hypothetical protein DPEC_G00010680 [Dallia pectoralis]|uniref:Uncharacterized protein n=1 Tax=Dallia pectoralis TaxID=75939 RepID=A0ACC2HLD2_DALPE|nr:hypothetical protein DPEC_G00010680 [Dallia pectoralis]
MVYLSCHPYPSLCHGVAQMECQAWRWTIQFGIRAVRRSWHGLKAVCCPAGLRGMPNQLHSNWSGGGTLGLPLQGRWCQVCTLRPLVVEKMISMLIILCLNVPPHSPCGSSANTPAEAPASMFVCHKSRRNKRRGKKLCLHLNSTETNPGGDGEKRRERRHAEFPLLPLNSHSSLLSAL